MNEGQKHIVISYPAGAVIFREGDFRTHLYIVQKGQIGILKFAAQNERIPLGIVSSGEYLGEAGLLDDKTSHGSWAIALSDSELIAIPVAAIKEQLKSAPQWLIALMRGNAQKLRRMNDLVRRNKIADESLDAMIMTIQDNALKSKTAKKDSF